MKRILKLNYRRNDMAALLKWFNDNDYQFELTHAQDVCVDQDGFPIIGTLMLEVTLYTEEAEVATRLKWNIEND